MELLKINFLLLNSNLVVAKTYEESTTFENILKRQMQSQGAVGVYIFPFANIDNSSISITAGFCIMFWNSSFSATGRCIAFDTNNIEVFNITL